MVILRSQNKIIDFLMILAWASPFNTLYMHITCMYEAYKDAALSLVHRLIYNTHPPE